MPLPYLAAHALRCKRARHSLTRDCPRLQSLRMPRYFPQIEDFLAIAKDVDFVPVYRQLLSDHLTPVTAFELLGRDAHALLLESVVGNEKIGRFSFIASSPSLVYQVKDGRVLIEE